MDQQKIKKLSTIIILLTIVGISAVALYQRLRPEVEPADNQVSQQQAVGGEDKPRTLPAQVQIDSGSQIKKPGSDKEVEKSSLPPVAKTAGSVEGSASLGLSGTKIYSQGGEVALDVIFDSAQVADGIEFGISYPVDKLSSVQFVPAATGLNYLKTEVDQDAGRIRVIALRNPGAKLSIGEISLGNISAVAKGSGQVELDFIDEESLVAASGGKDILQSTQGIILTIN